MRPSASPEVPPGEPRAGARTLAAPGAPIGEQQQRRSLLLLPPPWGRTRGRAYNRALMVLVAVLPWLVTLTVSS